MKAKTTYIALTILSVSLAGAAPINYVNNENNLIKNGNFEKGPSGWRGDEKVVAEASNKSNNICMIEVSDDEDIKFSQKIKTRNINNLTIKYRVKTSSDYVGEGLGLQVYRDNGGSGTSRTLLNCHDWNDVEWKASGVVRGVSEVTIIFTVKKGNSGTVSIDDIAVFDSEQVVEQSVEPKTSEASTAPKKADEYQIFTDKNGREIEAKILCIDSKGTKVTVQKKENRRSITVPVNVFNAETQAYFRSWLQKSDFFNERILTVDIRNKREKVADKSTSSSSSTFSRSTTSVYYGHAIEMVIQNKSDRSVKDVSLEYVLFYKQDFSRSYEKQGTLYDEQTISLPSKGKKEIKTEQIILHTYSSESDLGSSPNMTGNLEGIIIRLSFRTDAGEIITREIVHPEGRKFKWTTETKNVQQAIP